MSLLRELSESQKLDWLHLLRCDNIGPRHFHYLLSRFSTAEKALKALPELIKSGRMANIRITPRDEAEREYAATLAKNIRILAFCEPAYTPALREIDTPPPLLFVRGPLDLNRPVVSLVGSRNASTAGLVFAERLARGLGEAGYVIASGLARGIDAKAHRAGLATGTLAVLAGGHNRIYPSEHVQLAEDIAISGALMSEMPLNWEPRGRDFPRRNRLVAGVALATVVIEAALRSGSLITARLANEQGRQVFAVPGSPLDPRAEGTNNLLREGASLCTQVSDVVDALAAVRQSGLPLRDLFSPGPSAFQESEDEWIGAPFTADVAEGEDVRALVSALLGPVPVALDDLIRSSGLEAQVVHSVLLDLELDGSLQRHGNGMLSLL